ncbi:MAG: DUF6491 family protein [Woeseia sp.]
MKQSIYHIFTISIVCMLSLAACAQAEPKKFADEPELRGSDCILIRTIRDYTPLDDRTLLIWGPAKRGYLVKLSRPAFGIRSSFGLGFSSRDDQLCPYGGDSIVFGTMGDDEVSVQSISRVSKEQAEELKIRYGKKGPAENTPAAPDAVKGAEVEELD